MKKSLVVAAAFLMLLTGCANEFNRVYKTTDVEYKYEYAKECFAMGKYTRAVLLLQDIVTMMKGRENGQECLYMLAMASYCGKDYETAAQYFKRYYTSYPKGTYAEMASFYVGQSLYMSTPEPRLDQSPTMQAIAAYQEYLDLFPNAIMKDEAHERLYELQDKLVDKELYSAKLYYDLGSYFGNCTSGGSNYEACIITAQNAIKDFPFSRKREEFAVLVMKSKYELAQRSVEERRLDRFRDAEDECYGFINEYPDSEYRKTAEKYIEVCKKYTKGFED
ncbi:MAG: outer membrane protein assembly factor BamD [Prevotella sp.]|nr:outer membrane protein assembly factor BamD [Prevotella sp.]